VWGSDALGLKFARGGASAKRKRMMRKVSVALSLQDVLRVECRRLCGNESLLTEKVIDRRELFTRVCMEWYGERYSNVRNSARSAWGHMLDADRLNWRRLSCICFLSGSERFKAGAKLSPDSEDAGAGATCGTDRQGTRMARGSHLDSVGFMLTHHFHFAHFDQDPCFRQAISGELSDDAMTAAVAAYGGLDDEFEAYVKFAQGLARTFKTKYYAAAFELSLHGKQRGNIHGHLFCSVAPDNLSKRKNCQSTIAYADLSYGNFAPDVRKVCLVGAPRCYGNIIAGGLYYCIVRKIGSLRSFSPISLKEPACIVRFAIA
jgi:hypothetical protein